MKTQRWGGKRLFRDRKEFEKYVLVTIWVVRRYSVLIIHGQYHTPYVDTFPISTREDTPRLLHYFPRPERVSTRVNMRLTVTTTEILCRLREERSRVKETPTRDGNRHGLVVTTPVTGLQCDEETTAGSLTRFRPERGQLDKGQTDSYENRE